LAQDRQPVVGGDDDAQEHGSGRGASVGSR
jgi:hypothetical protein